MRAAKETRSVDQTHLRKVTLEDRTSRRGILLLFAVLLLLSSCSQQKINRREVVHRHNVTITETGLKPMQVGNGEIAFNVDITGLQTFQPHNTISHWGFHSMPLPEGLRVEDFRGITYNLNGRPVEFEINNPAQPELSKWLAANPHPVNLGRIGLMLTHKDGSAATMEQLSDPVQTLDLWTGIITSSFVFDNTRVEVRTACHPRKDQIGVEVNSDLIASGQLKISVEFPYADDREFPDNMGDYTNHQRHKTHVHDDRGRLRVERTMDDLRYYVNIESGNDLQYEAPAPAANPHRLVLVPTLKAADYTFHFSREAVVQRKNDNVFKASAEGWEDYWESGAAIDFSACTDSRAPELERRIVLSQYLLKVNNSGSLPPAETGLLKNSWYGKFHFEMIWWHGVHFALWDRWKEVDTMLQVYQKFLPTSKQRAERQGYRGARWPKATGNIDREWPFVIHAFLVWQQPHPIYFAELDYRLHPEKETLKKWEEIVFETAEFMASYAVYDSISNRYDLGPPLFLMSENSNHNTTKNGIFELAYWQFGLRTAVEWKMRVGQPVPPSWTKVLNNLAPLPVQDGQYVTYEGIQDMWTKYNYEHPGLLATYGMLPGDGVDTTVLRSTFKRVLETWDFNRTWGWDFPVVAMTAGRLNEPETAIDMLLFENKHNAYDQMGYNSWVYFPANGGLLTAVAMMAGGWEGGPDTYAPGFPKNGKWNVKVEGFVKMP